MNGRSMFLAVAVACVAFVASIGGPRLVDATSGTAHNGFSVLTVEDPRAVASGAADTDPVRVRLENHTPGERRYVWTFDVAGVPAGRGTISVRSGAAAVVTVPAAGAAAPATGESAWATFAVDGMAQQLRWRVLGPSPDRLPSR